MTGKTVSNAYTTGTDREGWCGVGMREVYRLQQAMEEIFRVLQQELG